ncbi:MAG: DMT family transporter [Myxococcota bacterium]
MLAATFLFSLMAVCVKRAGESGLPTAEIVMARGLITLALSSIMLRRAGISPWGVHRPLLLARGLAGVCGLSCFYYSVTHLPLADVSVLHKVNPVLTSLFAALALGEGLHASDFVAGGMAVLGVILVARPSFIFEGASLELFPVAIALLGACFSSIAYVIVRQLRKTDHPLVVVFFFPLVAVPACLPFLLPVAVWPRGEQWLYLLGVGVFTQLAQVEMTKGLHAERAGRAMAMSYVQILFATAWGLLLFGERPQLLAAFGAVIIFSATLLVLRARRSVVS